jgi:hypothetical protein
MTTRADRHDVDKLHRWRRDLLDSPFDSPSSRFPVYAVFLVSEADTAAHDVFRRFRSSFEEREAGFGNLVIFGQHGVSTTVRLLLEQLGLASDSLPMLALWDGAGFPQVSVAPLPAGESAGDEPGSTTAGQLLSRVERLADDGGGVLPGVLPGSLDVAGIPGVSKVNAPGKDLGAWVSALAETSGG